MEQGNVFRLTATEDAVKGIVVSIPLEQGNVFRLYLPLFHQLNQQVSIPLEQGNVFRPSKGKYGYWVIVSIPLEQGNVFRLQWGVRALCGKASQSHFPTFSDV